MPGSHRCGRAAPDGSTEQSCRQRIDREADDPMRNEFGFAEGMDSVKPDRGR
jgi:hypothetical protein